MDVKHRLEDVQKGRIRLKLPTFFLCTPRDHGRKENGCFRTFARISSCFYGVSFRFGRFTLKVKEYLVSPKHQNPLGHHDFKVVYRL
jgi:hypothetical protein